MISRTILTVVLVIISEAGNTTITSKDGTNGRVSASRTKRSEAIGSVCIPYGLDDRLFQNGGYCKDIIGNLPVYGQDIYELYYNEEKLRRYQTAKDFLLQTRKNLTNGQQKILDGSFETRQSCLDSADDIYCHYYFERCYINSTHQLLCREACEELYFKLCDREYKLVTEFNNKNPIFPFYWDIINCTTLPFRNESRNCYYPDKIRDKLDVLESEDCLYGDGRGYRGNADTTVSGYTCQSWGAQSPHTHNIDEKIYEEVRNSSNFCRNPGGVGLNGPWCYTTNRAVRWEYCDVPKCAKQPPSSPPADFRGHNLSSTSLKVFWGDVPKRSVNGILLGFHVVCERLNSTDRHFVHLAPGERNWEFKELDKFTTYSCWVRAWNNFGNGTWSKKLVILTDEDVPSAPPESLRAWNLSSTSLHVQWGPIPVKERHGKILGYEVEIRPDQEKQSKRKTPANYTTSRSLTFRGLKKYSKYVISVYGTTRRGQGPNRRLIAQTDEDVPDRPPRQISAVSLGTEAVQLNWSPVSPEYTNGEVLGYRAFYNNVNDTSRVNSTVASPEETLLKIDGLRPNTNYSFRILAFTAKGDGAISTNYFAKTSLVSTDKKRYNDDKRPSRATAGREVIIVTAVVSITVAVGAVFVAIHFVRKKNSPSTNDGNILSRGVIPYAISSPNWIEDSIARHRHGYETLDDENVPTTSRQPFYINITPNGSLDLPPYLRDIVFEFEQLYENTKYKRLYRYGRRRSLGGAVDVHSNPIYDKLQRVISPCMATCQRNSCSQEAQELTTAETSKEYKQHYSVDLGELRGFVQAIQGDVCGIEMTELGAVGKTRHRHRRHFSVDMGEVREFIALREMRMSSKDKCTALTYQPDVQQTSHNEITC